MFSFILLMCAFLLLRRTSRGVILSIDNIVILGISFLWGIIFPSVYFYSISNPNNEYLIIISTYDEFDLVIYYFCILIFLFTFIKTFRLLVNRHFRNFLFGEEKISEVVNYKVDRIYVTSILLLVVGIVSDFLYCRAYGGYLAYLEYSALIRSGITNIVNNRWSFLIVFRNCVKIASYLFFSQIKKNGKFQYKQFGFFLISFVYSLLILYSNKGRISFLIYITVFVITYLLNRKRIKFINIKMIFFVICIFLLFCMGIGKISDVVGRSSRFDGFELLYNEVAFVFSNFKLLLNELDISNIRLFADIIFYPLYLLPSSLWRKIMPNTASDVMTILALGNKKGQGGVFGEVPIDAISIGYLQFGIIGVFIFAIFFGIISAQMYILISKKLDNKSREILQVYVIIDLFLRSLIYADSYNIVQRSFPLIIFALLYWGIGLLNKTSTSDNQKITNK